MKPSLTKSSLLALALCGGLAAQQPILRDGTLAPPAPEAVAGDLDRISPFDDHAGPHAPRADRAMLGAADGSLWGIGAGYRIELAPGHVEFTPVLGEKVPRNFPLRMQLASVRRGQTVALSTPAAVSAERDDLHAWYSHETLGAGVIQERYEMLPDGVELSFVFEKPLPGSGDLAVRMDTRTDLTGPRGERLGGLRLDAEDFGWVEIGGVTGIDARGNRCEGWLNRTDEALEMVLPAEFVDSASWPIVLDPLLGGRTSSGVSFQDHYPDVAYDRAHDVWAMTFEFRVSAADTDVWVSRVRGADGQRLPNGAAPVAIGPGQQRHGAIGNQRWSAQFVIAWSQRENNTNNVYTRVLMPADGAMGPVATVAATADSESHPDVAGDSSNLDDECLVAWDVYPGGFRAAQVKPRGTSSAPTIFGTTDIPAPVDAMDLHITETGGSAGRYLFVWWTRDSNRTYIAFRRSDRNLNLDQQTWLLPAPPSGGSVGSPAVAGDGDDALIVYTFSDGTPRIIGYHVDLRTSALSSNTGAFVIEGDPNEAEDDPAVCYFGNDVFGVVWANQYATHRKEVHGVNVRKASRERCGREFSTSFGSNHDVRGLVAASMWEGGLDADGGMIHWETLDHGNSNSLCAYQRFEALGRGGRITDRGGQCGRPTVLTPAGGPFALGNPNFRLEVRTSTIAPFNAYMSFAFGPTPQTFRCGSGCELLLPVATIPFQVIGSGAISLPVTCDPNVHGLQLHAQALLLTPNYDPCNLAPVSLSNRLEMVHGD